MDDNSTLECVEWLPPKKSRIVKATLSSRCPCGGGEQFIAIAVRHGLEFPFEANGSQSVLSVTAERPQIMARNISNSEWREQSISTAILYTNRLDRLTFVAFWRVTVNFHRRDGTAGWALRGQT